MADLPIARRAPVAGARVVTGKPIVYPGTPGAPAARPVVKPGLTPRRVVGIPVGPTTGRRWENKYDWAVDPNKELGQVRDLEEVIAEAGNDPWTIAPATSHVEAFRLIDSSSIRKVVVYDVNGRPRAATVGSKLTILHARSGLGTTIDVRFKAKGPRPVYTYRYFFRQDHARARDIFNAMAQSESPWTIGHQQLELAGVPYTRISGHYGG